MLPIPYGDGYEPEQDDGQESLRPPENGLEWYDAVVTEIVWETGRTLPCTEPILNLLSALYSRGANPSEAAIFIMERCFPEIPR
jgi:hypothetical protein